MEEERCPICKGLSEDKTAHAFALQKATRAATKKANELASKPRPEGIAWIDMYMTYYRTVFEHEYRRHEYVETERVLERLVEKYQNDRNVCGYHSENVGWLGDGFHEECQKNLRRQFAESKWPRELQYNQNGRVGTL